MVRLAAPLIVPASSTWPELVPLKSVLAPSTQSFEITKPPVPFCWSSGATPASVSVLPMMYWVAVELLVSTMRLAIRPVKPLLAV